jgi:isoquinoline 1-oxidoreductase beta subunit
VPDAVSVKAPKDWKIIGKGVARLDLKEKLSGSPAYGIDVVLPGMLNAAIAQCPVFGGKLESYDEKAILQMPGVKRVIPVDDNAVAVVADKWYHAKMALASLPIKWNFGPNVAVSSDTIASELRAGLDATDALPVQNIGDIESALASAAQVVTASYGTPFLNNATMEPMNCTALLKDDGGVEIWVPTQDGMASLREAAKAAGCPEASVIVNKRHLGGGFGRRFFNDYTRQAVLIAKEMRGLPVKLIWSREEDMQHGFYRPVTQCKLVGALDKDGKISAMHMRLSGPSILRAVSPERLVGGVDRHAFQGMLDNEYGYMQIPNIRMDHAFRPTPVPLGFWRGVNHNQNALYMECFIDELAHAAGQDPLEFRRAHMSKNPKHRAVLNAAAERAGWGSPLPPGVFRGISQNYGYGSYTAAVAEVSISPEGKLRIKRIVAAIDPGYVLNPDQVDVQIAGSYSYGLGALLKGQNTIKDGRIVEQNFDDYDVMRMNEMPVVETVAVPSGGFWGGVGEPTIAVGAPAVLNAIFAATGKRIRTLPLSNHDLRGV